MSDNYPIPLAGASAPHTASLLIKRSRFLTQIARTGTPEEARAFIERIRSLNTDATHNCWAFVAGPPGSTARIGAFDSIREENLTARLGVPCCRSSCTAV